MDIARRRATENPDAVAFIYPGAGEEPDLHLTYGELDARARALAVLLAEHKAQGERVLLFYLPGSEFMIGMLACLYAGAIGIPLFPPRAHRSLHRILGIVADARPQFALTNDSLVHRVSDLCTREAATQNLTVLSAADSVPGLADSYREKNLTPDSVAYLQYTSGSTSAPRGVILDHGNLLHNCEILKNVAHLRDRAVNVTWLPHFHDMGLVDGLLAALYAGIPGVVLSPAAFLQKPIRWLEAISRFRGTHSGAPNFAYDLCVDKITPEERDRLDLSSWFASYSGAEPVRRETIERFIEFFEPVGYRPTFAHGTYGMAEATLLISSGEAGVAPIYLELDADALGQNRIQPADAESRRTTTLVGCGPVMPGQTVAIVDPETGERCPPDRVGEIWVRGRSIARGYWNAPEASQHTFGNLPVGEDKGPPYLRTGDLGFIRENQLFISGRLKDLIIVHGQNYYPQDIEQVSEASHEALAPAASAAIGVPVAGQERLVIIQELKRHQDHVDPEEIVEAIRDAVSLEHEIQVYGVLLVSPGTILKTSSGKIKRRAHRAAFLDGSLQPVYSSILDFDDATFENEEALPLTRQELSELNNEERKLRLLQFLKREAARLLRTPADLIKEGKPLLMLGLDSLMTVQWKNRIESELGIVVPLTEIIQNASLGTVADLILEQIRGDGTGRITAPGSMDLTDHFLQTTPITPIDRTQRELQLSFDQQIMWLIAQLEPDLAAYNVPVAVHMTGAVDLDALRKSIRHIVQRHEGLRTTFPSVGGQPGVRISAEANVHLQTVDLTGWEAVDREKEIRLIFAEEVRRPFNLATGPLLRMVLIKESDTKHILVICLHHIVCDGWSISLFFRELNKLYEAYASGREPVLPPLPIQYVDFAGWQREWLNNMMLESQLSYWEEKLAGAPPAIDLPLDLPRPALPTYSGRIVDVLLDSHLMEKVAKIARDISGTPFMVLTAALKILLYRWTGQTDLVVGTVVANRNKIETEHLIGCFVNFLALRSEIEPGSTGMAVLRQEKETILEAYAHQDCPFEKVVEVSRTDTKSSLNPLYNVAFLLQNYPRAPFYLKSFAARLEQLGTASAHLDLRFIAEPVSEGIRFECDFNVDIFQVKTIQDLLGYYRTLLENLCDDPGMEVEDYGLLTQEEEKQQIFALTGGLKKFYSDTGIHHLFEEQAALEPARIALVFEDFTFSYRETNERANRLANYLIARGAGPDRPVAIFLERTPALIIAILAVLKTGAAYIPIDTRYPRDRIAFMRRDSGARLVLTESTMAPTFTEATPEDEGDFELIVLEREREQIDRSSPANPGLRVGGAALCYMIYTSGSTGTPKGCEVTHTNLVRLFQATRNLYSFSPDDVWSLFHSAAFDVSVFEMWGALIHGARLVIAPFNVIRSPEQFYDLCIRRGVTILSQTPSAFRQFTRVDENSRRRNDLRLRYIIFAGESLSMNQLEGWVERHGDSEPQLVNMYGITETTVHVTFRRITRRDLKSNKSLIGAPMPDLQIYLLDARGRMVPPGFPGEIYVVGDGVARGYHNRPELTAERFMPDSISGNLDQRVYRSGDLGRYLPNGDMEYLGRMDKQVKIRGFRIEPGEIESALREYPGIAEALVVPMRGQGEDTALTTYLVVDPQAVGGGEIEKEDEKISSHNRTDLRVPFKTTCQVLTEIPVEGDPEESDQWQTLSTENISCSGTVLSGVKSSLPYGRGIRLQLELPPHGIEISLQGTVVWRRGGRAGVRFKTSGAERDVLYSTVSDIARGQGFARTQIRNFLKRRLPDYMIPANYVLLNSLPLTHNGKIDFRALPEPVRVHGNRVFETGFVAPRDSLELQLTKIWEEVLNVRPLGVTDNFFEQGGHSLLAVQLIAHIKQKFRADLPLAVLFNAGTIEHMATLLRGQVTGESHSPLVEINPMTGEAGEDRPLFFVHPAGGNVLCFVHLARNLGRDQPFYGLQTPGLDVARMDFRAVEDLAGLYIQAVRQVQPQGPYLLGGYSFGGTVAFEMARQLHAAGESVQRLMLLDSWAPIYTPRYDDATLVAFFALEITGSMSGLTGMHELEELRNMTGQEQQEFLLRVAQRAQFLPPDSDLTRVQNYYQVFKNNTRAEQLYRPELDRFPITIFRASHSLLDEVQDSRFLSRVLNRAMFEDPTFGWDDFTDGGVDIFFIPGNHLNILVEPQVRTLADRLKRCIREAAEEIDLNPRNPAPAARSGDEEFSLS